jgi:WD40 repeat protein/serine/threonine protein kinase/tetratricopeptide (TPR) repeat protein
MSDFAHDPNAVGKLADEFLARHRRGERPDISEYTERYPALADEIRDLFPALLMMEDLKPGTSDGTGQYAGEQARTRLERLGDFRILREVGRGGMGIVYEAEQESLGRRVALKVLPSQALLDPRQQQRFQREARAAARLHHTNIVPVFGVGDHDGLHYYVMQFIQGLALNEVVAELRRLRQARSSPAKTPSAGATAPAGEPPRPATMSVTGVAQALLTGQFAAEAAGDGKAVASQAEAAAAPPADAARPPGGSTEAGSTSGNSSPSLSLPGQSGVSSLTESGRHYWQSVARIGVQVADALEYAHGQGVFHRDIKPSNLLLDTQGNVWVTDFGLAKAATEGDNLTHTGDIVGTLRYMAPERFQGRSDARADVYSLGLTLYEMLVLKPAYHESDRNRLIQLVTQGEPVQPRKLNRAIPLDLETIVLKAVEREPARRYPSAAAMGEDLKRFLDDKPIHARRVGPRERLWRWSRRNPALALASGLAAVALLAVTILSVVLNISQSRSRADMARAFQDLTREQSRTQEALTQTETLANNLAAEQKRTKDALARQQALAKNLAAEEKRTRDALAESQQRARDLQTEQKRLKEADRRTQAALHEARTQSATLLVERGQSMVERQAPAQGMLWLARGLETAPADADDVQRVARTNLAGLENELPHLRTVLQHSGAPTVAVFSPDGKTVLTAVGGTVQLWDARSGKPGRKVSAHLGSISFAVAWSPDGKRFLTGGTDRAARLWDTATCKLVDKPLFHPDAVVAVAFSPNGKTFLTGCNDDRVRLWDAATGKPVCPPLENVRSIPNFSATTFSEFSPDGKVVLTGVPGTVVRLWDTATGKPIGRPLVHPNTVAHAAFSPDGRTVFTGCFDTKARLWDVATGQLRGRAIEHTDWVFAVAFRPDGKAVLTGTRDGVAQLWDVATGRRLGQPMQQGNRVSRAFFSPDGQIVITEGAEGDARIRLWDADSGRPLGEPLVHRSSVGDVRFSPDGRAFLTLSRDQAVRIWELPAGRQVQAPLAHLDPIEVLAISPDGTTLVTGSGDFPRRNRGEAQLWDVATGQPIGPPLLHKNAVDAVAFSPDGKWVLTGSLDHTARLWDAATGKPLGGSDSEPFKHDASVWVVAFSPDGKTIATGGYDKTVRLWDARTRQAVGAPLPHSQPVTHLAFSRDGTTLATGCRDNIARLWDVRTGRLRGKLMRHAANVRRVVFSPDGRLLLTGGFDNTARFWDARTGEPMGQPLTHSAPVAWLAFTPDGKTVLTGGGRTVQLWDAASRKLLGQPMQHQEALGAAALSPDGEIVLTGSEDGTARLWSARTGHPLGAPMAHPGKVTAVAFSPDGRRVVTGCADRQVRFWTVPSPLPGKTERLARWVEVRTNFQLTPENLVLPLDLKTWEQRWRRLDELGGTPAPAAGLSEGGFGWHQRLAADAAATGHWFAARWHLDRVVAARPRDWFAYAQRGRVRLRLGEREEAARDCGDALRLGPAETVRDWFTRQSPDYDSELSWATALWFLDQLIQARPKDGLAHASRTKALVQLGRLDQAAEAFDRAIALGPEDDVEVRFIAYCNECETREQWTTDMWYLDKLARPMSGDWGIFNRQGEAYAKLQRLDRAAIAFVRATELNPTRITPWDHAAILQLQRGDVAGYARVCGRCLSRFTNEAAQARQQVAWFCLVGPAAPADRATALRLAAQAARENPRAFHMINTHGAALYRVGRYKEALPVLEHGVAVHGSGGRVWDWVFLAMVHHRLGHAAEARKWLDQTVDWLDQSTPDKPKDARSGIPIGWDAWIGMQLLRYEAEALIRGSSATTDPAVRLAFARAHVRLDRWGKALADYDLALQTSEVSKTSEVWAERARCNVRLGHWQQAAADFTRALQSSELSQGTEVWGARARCWARLKQADKAAADYGRVATRMARALADQRAEFEKSAEDSSGRQQLDPLYRDLAEAQALAGWPVSAADTLMEWGDLYAGHAEKLYEAAGRIAALIPTIPHGEPPASASTRRLIGDEAMGVLRNAILAGLRDLSRIPGDPALYPLQARDDFKALLAELGRPGDFPAPTGEIDRWAGHAPGKQVSDVVLSGDGRIALTAGWDGTARVWDVATGRQLRRLEGFGDRAGCASLSRDGRRALVAGDGTAVVVWDVTTRKVIRRFTKARGWTGSGRLSPDGRRALFGDAPDLLRLGDLDTGKVLRTLKGHAGQIQDVAISRDGRRALSGSRDGTMCLWDLETGKLLRRRAGHAGVVGAVEFSHDGRQAVSGCADGVVRLWDLETGVAVRRFEGHGAGRDIGIVAVSPDGKRVLSGSRDRKLMLWDAATGRLLHQFVVSGDHFGAAFLPGGRRALSADGDGGVHLWSLSEHAARAREHARLGERAAAEVAYARAVAAANDPALWIERGRFWARLGEWASADADVARAVAQGADDQHILAAATDFYRRRSEVARKLGRAGAAKWAWQQARTLFEKRLAAQRDNPCLAAEFAAFLLTTAPPDRPEAAAKEAVSWATTAVEHRPTDALALLVRGDLYARLDRHDRAAADFAAALRVNRAAALAGHRELADAYDGGRDPRRALVHVEALLRAEHGTPAEAGLLDWRGRLYARSAQWKAAAAEFARRFQTTTPDDRDPWLEHAYLLVQVGDAEGYRKLCAGMVKQFGNSHNGEEITALAHAVVLGPGGAANAARALRLGEILAGSNAAPSHFHALAVHIVGLADYRAGKLDAAIEWLNQGLNDDPEWDSRVLNWLVLSMAHQRLGHAAEARQWLDRADRWIRNTTRDRPADTTEFAPPGWSWANWLGVQLLRAEAGALVRSHEPASANRPR